MDEIQIGKLALRQEGNMWNAYYAFDNWEDRILLGSIKLTVIHDFPDIKEYFATMMEEVVLRIIEEVSGVKPRMDEPRKAPESERSGHA